MSNLVAIDTGLNEAGWAVWRGVDVDTPVCAPFCSGCIRLPGKVRSLPWETRANLMMIELATGPLGWLHGGTLAVEMPAFRASDAVGHAAASGDSLGMLYFMCGMMARQAELVGAKMRYARPQEWKGSMTKRQVIRRLARVIGTEDESGEMLEEHAWDAVGIGLNAMGHRLNDAKKFGKTAHL